MSRSLLVNLFVFLRNVSVEFYFLFFILINLLDFFNVISSDLDFFKKFLSWFLIGLIFYKAQLSRVLIGERNRVLDFLYLLCSFCLSSVKTFEFYLKGVLVENFSVFFDLVVFFKKYVEGFSLVYFFVGLVFLVLLTFFFNRIEVLENSLIFSFNLRNDFFYSVKKFFLIFSVLFFFAVTVFNFFMEWFALAVDSIILFLGLIFYLFKLVEKRVLDENVLSVISNSGNDFYRKLIDNFCDKRTFFLSIGFLLTLHLMIDLGVFMLPYLTGLENSLYSFESSSHRPVFNFFDFSDSVFVENLSLNYKFNSFLFVVVFVLHFFLNAFFLVLSLFFPFFILYRFISREVIVLNLKFVFLYIVSGFYFIFNWFFDSNVFKITFSNSSVQGVDLQTKILSSSDFVLVLSCLIFVLLVLLVFFVFFYRGFFLSSFSSVKELVKGSFFVLILIFFSFYLLLFFFSLVSSSYDVLREDLFLDDFSFVEADNFVFNDSLPFSVRSLKVEDMNLSYDFNVYGYFLDDSLSFYRVVLFSKSGLQVLEDDFFLVDGFEFLDNCSVKKKSDDKFLFLSERCEFSFFLSPKYVDSKLSYDNLDLFLRSVSVVDFDDLKNSDSSFSFFKLFLIVLNLSCVLVFYLGGFFYLFKVFFKGHVDEFICLK